MLNWLKKGNPEIKVSTNINLGSCVVKVKPFLDEDSRIESWVVDNLNPKKVLTVKGSISLVELSLLLNDAGYIIKE